MDEFDPDGKMEGDPLGDRPVRACRTQQGENAYLSIRTISKRFKKQTLLLLFAIIYL